MSANSLKAYDLKQFQVVFHLSQLTSAAFSPRRPLGQRTVGTNTNKQVSRQNTDEEDVVICRESLNTLTERPKFGSSFPWHVSYVCGDSFTETKNESPNTRYQAGNTRGSVTLSSRFEKKLLHHLLTGKPFAFGVQVRGFKTEHSILAERARNPTWGDRLRVVFGLSQPSLAVGSHANKQAEKSVLTHPDQAEKLKCMCEMLICVNKT
uniref:Uncharacterized protein n=1 Tax=Timema poppense TaxID=170557 RepID=A0A7R9H620_TIMPO|nr:unnamed protein product [Timema poppensis]